MKGFFDIVRISIHLIWRNIKEFIASYLHAQFLLFSSVGFLIDLESKETSIWDGRKKYRKRSLTSSHSKSSIFGHLQSLPNTMQK